MSQDARTDSGAGQGLGRPEKSPISRELKLEGMRQWCEAVTEAQRQGRPYCWHRCFSLPGQDRRP